MKILHRDDVRTELKKGTDLPGYVCIEVTIGSMRYIDRYKDPFGSNPVFVRLDNIWQKIISIFDYETSGKQILELGCGANGQHVESDFYHHKYQPWLLHSAEEVHLVHHRRHPLSRDN